MYFVTLCTTRSAPRESGFWQSASEHKEEEGRMVFVINLIVENLAWLVLLRHHSQGLQNVLSTQSNKFIST